MVSGKTKPWEAFMLIPGWFGASGEPVRLCLQARSCSLAQSVWASAPAGEQQPARRERRRTWLSNGDSDPWWGSGGPWQWGIGTFGACDQRLSVLRGCALVARELCLCRMAAEPVAAAGLEAKEGWVRALWGIQLHLAVSVSAGVCVGYVRWVL